MSKYHVCVVAKTCCCSVLALEPNEDCPVHGVPYPPRCETCGRFLPHINRDANDKPEAERR